MRWIGTLAVLVAFSSSALRTTAGELAQAHPVLSGFATNALVRAYHASGLDTNISAPLRLRSYVVTIYTSGDDFWIMFNDTASMEVHNILVAARTASVVWRAGDPGGEVYSNPTTTEALMLPGVVAGEIILAYREGSRCHYKPFQTGAYYTVLTPWPGGTYIAFWQTQEPTSVSINPAPTPTPEARCSSDCATTAGYLIPGYMVRASSDRVSIQPDFKLCGQKPAP